MRVWYVHNIQRRTLSVSATVPWLNYIHINVQILNQVKSIQPKVRRSQELLGLTHQQSTYWAFCCPWSCPGRPQFLTHPWPTMTVPHAPLAHDGARTGAPGAGARPSNSERNCSPRGQSPFPTPRVWTYCVLQGGEVVTGHTRDKGTQNWTHMVTSRLPSHIHSRGIK